MTESKRPRIPRGLKADGAALWSYGFRPFFLAAAAYGPLLLALWYVVRSGWWMRPDAGLALPLLHAHELLFGFDRAGWQAEFASIGEYLQEFGTRTPQALKDEQQRIAARLAN